MRSLARTTIYSALCCIVCVAATLLAFTFVRSAAYLQHHDLMGLTSALGRATRDVCQMVGAIGTGGMGRLLGNYLVAYSLVIAGTLVVGYRTGWNRAAPFFVIAVLFLLIAAFTFPDRGSPTSLPRSRALDFVAKQDAMTISNALPAADSWQNYTLHYPWWALPASLAAGALFAILPIWRRSQMYWLNRHRCPGCQYALAGDMEQGCSECGWNRVGASAGSEVIRVTELASIHKRTSVACICWTVAGLITYGLLMDRILGVVPLVVRATPHVSLRFPHSDAYLEVRIDATIKAQQRWFVGQSDDAMDLHNLNWSACFFRTSLPGGDTIDINAASTPEVLAVNDPANMTWIGTVSVDALKSTSTFDFANEQSHVDSILDAQTFKTWMRRVFPDADPELLSQEARAILKVAEKWKQSEPVELATDNWLPSVLYDAFGQVATGGPPPRERWATGPLLLVIGCALLPWAYGFILIARVHRSAHLRRASAAQR